MISKNFLKSSAIYTLAGSLPLASAFMLMPFYLVFLPTSAYGALSLYLASSLFVQILVMYSFDTSLYIHFHEYKSHRNKLASFVSSAFIFMLLIAAALLVVSCIAGPRVFQWAFADKKETILFYPIGLMAVFTGIFQALFKVYTNLLQSREMPGLFLRSNLLQFAMIAVLTVAGLYIFPETLIGPIGARVIAGLISAMWVLYRIYTEFGFKFDYPLLKSTFGFNHYSFIYQVQQWFINNADRFIIVFVGLSLSMVGVYDFALKCLVVIEVIMSGLNNSFYPKVVSTVMAQTEKSTTPEINRYYHGLISVITLLVMLAILVVPLGVYWLDRLLHIDKGYISAIPYFPFIAVLFILRVVRMYFAYPYAVLKYTKPLPVIYTFVTILKIALMILLINFYQIYGLVFASLISLTIEIVTLRFWIKDRFIFKFNPVKIFIVPFALLAGVLIVEPLFGRDYPLPVHTGYVLVTAISLLWIYRNELKALKLKV